MSYNKDQQPDPGRRGGMRGRTLNSSSAEPPTEWPSVHQVAVETALPSTLGGDLRTRPGLLRKSEKGTEIFLSAPRVKEVGLLSEPAARKGTGSQQMSIRAPAGWQVVPAAVHFPGSSLISMPAVIDGQRKIAGLPHRRKGLAPRQIEDREVESHLSEAQAAKGISAEDSRLLAVFRKVPVELISQMRFDESRRILLYRLIPCERLRSTRIHDLAAVKDLSTGKTHLIRHRARYRTVPLCKA